MVSKSSPQKTEGKPASSIIEARRLVDEIERSQVPFGESAPLYARIKAQVDAGRTLTAEDHEHLKGLAKKAKDWEKAVQSSARTLPEETLSG